MRINGRTLVRASPSRHFGLRQDRIRAFERDVRLACEGRQSASAELTPSPAELLHLCPARQSRIICVLLFFDAPDLLGHARDPFVRRDPRTATDAPTAHVRMNVHSKRASVAQVVVAVEARPIQWQRQDFLPFQRLQRLQARTKPNRTGNHERRERETPLAPLTRPCIDDSAEEANPIKIGYPLGRDFASSVCKAKGAGCGEEQVSAKTDRTDTDLARNGTTAWSARLPIPNFSEGCQEQKRITIRSGTRTKSVEVPTEGEIQLNCSGEF